MTNPFDVEDGEFFVLCNQEEQYSLWPAHIGIPQGWTVVYGRANRSECLAYIDREWTDMRPNSVRLAMQ